MNNRRAIPSVDHLLHRPEIEGLVPDFGYPLVLMSLREALEAIRMDNETLSEDSIFRKTAAILMKRIQPTLRPVINATGVILHTNLGRAILSRDAIDAMNAVAAGYSTLEFDLETGTRGSRSLHTSEVLKEITGAEDSMIVNNNASAVLLCLSALAKRRSVVISRSQLIEIGGGFRVPEVMKQSGAKLIEIGTTNRVHLSDYEEALKSGARVVMRAHSSNFKMIGFTEQPHLAEIVQLAHQYGAILIDDLGSGALVDTSKYGISHEPMVQESILAGVDLVCFSGDKLVGGPQAGIIAGRCDLIEKLRKHSLARALRADKVCLAGLSATLLHYLKGETEMKIPTWRMIAMPIAEIHERALFWKSTLGMGEVVEDRSTIGGGSLPEETLATYVFVLQGKRAPRLMRTLRRCDPPVIARVQKDQVMFDPRTIPPEKDREFLDLLKKALEGANL